MPPAPEFAQLTPPPNASSQHCCGEGVVVDLHKWKGAGQVTSPATDRDFIAMRASSVTPLVQRRGGGPWVEGSRRPSGLAATSLSLVLSYIEDNLGQRITLDDLARLANVSRFHFARLFRRSTGLSPMAYVERSRLQRSKDLIRSGTLSLTEIATLLGFADQSHFTRRFRRQFGYTPSAFSREQG